MANTSNVLMLEDALRDFRHGIRMLRRAPAFGAAALVTLALGIGATSATFSIVRTVLLEPLPYREPDRIVGIWETIRGGAARNVIAPANFVAWRDRTRTLEHLGMIEPTNVVMVLDGRPEQVGGRQFSAAAFQALGVQPALGRAYTAAEDSGAGSGAVIVLGYEFWQRRLGGRQDILGFSIGTDAGPRIVIGVMPRGFTVVGEKIDFLVPFGLTTAQLRAYEGRGNGYAVARLRAGVSFEQAASEMRRLFADLEREEPRRNARRTVILLHLQEQMVGEVRPALFALAGAVLLVLLIACVNVANLLVARGAAREGEMGIRAALGAGRGRLARQLIIESLGLAAAGGIGGVGVAVLCHRGLAALVGDRIPIPRLDQAAVDAPAILFTMAVSLATGLLFGVVPAFVSTAHARDSLRDGGRHGGGRRLHRALRTLVVVEVALSLVLLASAGLLMRSLLELQNTDPGFRAQGVLAAQVQLPAALDLARAGSAFAESLARVSALPGVRHAAASTCPPLPGACIGTSFWRADRPRPGDGQLASGQIRPITPGWFQTLAIQQLAGRDFSDADTADSAPVAIVSEALARERFGDEDPVGRRLRIAIDHTNGRTDLEWTIVGVVGSIRSSLDGPMRETIYLPATQRRGRFMMLFVRAQQDPMPLGPSIESIVHSREPDAAVRIRSLEDIVGRTIARPRAISVLVGAFALVALALAAVGVYGVMAYSVRQRTQEIGIRMALGATAASVLRLVLGQALGIVFTGIVAGLIAAAVVARLLARLLFGIEPLDPWTFGVTAMILVAVAAIASYVPAYRGMRLAPVEALRTE